jgi:DNA repair exonuclease SbcCD ATPase subunit
VLILESQKYESQLEFLATEREIILKAQLEGEDIDPLFQSVDLEQAEAKRNKIETEINTLNQEWFGKLEKIRDETEKVLSENEIKEFRSRIAILSAELTEKNSQIDAINREKQDMEKVAEKAMTMGL